MSHRTWQLGAVALGTALFGFSVASRHVLNPWVTNVSAALVVMGACIAIMGRQLEHLLRVRADVVARAAMVGLLLVAVTHASYAVLVGYIPGLERHVAALYGDIGSTGYHSGVMVPAIVTVVMAEELLWRGLGLDLCEASMSRSYAAVAAVGLYALPHTIGGSWVLLAAALGAGAVFTVQRMRSAGLAEPIISHAIWSVSIFCVLPLA